MWASSPILSLPLQRFATRWRNDPMVLCLPTSWSAPELVTPERLAGRRRASFAPATQMHGLVAAWFGQAGHHPWPFLTMSYPGALKSLAAASQSAAILPLEEVEDQQHAPVCMCVICPCRSCDRWRWLIDTQQRRARHLPAYWRRLPSLPTDDPWESKRQRWFCRAPCAAGCGRSSRRHGLAA